MVRLLQSPSLRKVRFKYAVCTNTICQAVAKALEERSEITELDFQTSSFPQGGCAVIARALKTNTTLKCLSFRNVADEPDEHLCEVLTAVLLSNSTLQDLALSTRGISSYNTSSCSWFSPLFLTLQVNNGLKKLTFAGNFLIDEKLSAAMRLGLGRNSTLETLKLSNIQSGDNDTALWREALSFLHTNTVLKTLEMDFEMDMTESNTTAIRMEVTAILRENKSLETLFMYCKNGSKDYLDFIAEIQPNTTLKRFRLHASYHNDSCVDDDETKDLNCFCTP
jgi:hypothetical protein